MTKPLSLFEKLFTIAAFGGAVILAGGVLGVLFVLQRALDEHNRIEKAAMEKASLPQPSGFDETINFPNGATGRVHHIAPLPATAVAEFYYYGTLPEEEYECQVEWFLAEYQAGAERFWHRSLDLRYNILGVGNFNLRPEEGGQKNTFFLSFEIIYPPDLKVPNPATQ